MIGRYHRRALTYRQPVGDMLRILFVLVGGGWALFGTVSLGRTAQDKPSRPPFPEISASDRPGFDEWIRLVTLGDREIVKRIPPPFPECRNAFWRAMNRFGPPRPAPNVAFYIWYPAPSNVPNARPCYAAASISSLLRSLVGVEVEKGEVEGDSELLKAPIDGDWIARQPESPEKLVPAIEGILRKTCKLPVKLHLEQVEREVVVAKGKWDPAALGNRERIDIYGKVFTEKRGNGGGSGNLDRFLNSVASYIRGRIVNEVENPPQGRWPVHWRYNSRLSNANTVNEGWNDRDKETVLKHVSEQTGMVFSNEKRKVRVLFVARAQ
ncbi:MAG: hypothetical protein ACLQNE_20825 [Thermoguttaceae bacterium]